ncbi:MAG: undecaprenyl-diphosphate phosphatase [Verrucomicrobiae bacterium]|nr:undecaprenyl-diphosphate phosphatase [Verrucomicrobiae bacterium]
MEPIELVKAAVLGVIEGLTEFLPISSTGHLLVAERLLHFDSELFTVAIQIGALAAVWWLFRHRFFAVIPGAPSYSDGGVRLGLQVLVAFFPVMLAGMLSHHWIQAHLFSPHTIAWALIGGGIVILLIEGLKPPVRVHDLDRLPWRLALAVGLGQCLALWPGVSRSGATIMTGLAVGMSRGAATEFTFLLSAPTMTAAAAYELWKHRHDLTADMALLIVVGLVVSFVVAYGVVTWLIRYVQSHTFESFAWYRIIAGAILLGMLSNGYLESHAALPR